MAARTTPSRHIKSPWGEVPERSEGGGVAREGESGRATAGSDKRPRPSNTHEQWRQREAVMLLIATPWGWWAGLQGRWWHRPPSLLHWDISILGRLMQAIIFRAVWWQPQGGGLPPPKLLGARPLWGRAHGMGAGGSPCGVAGRAALPQDPTLPPRRGYRLRPIWVGQRGICRELY